MIAANGATEDELAAIAAALLVIPSTSTSLSIHSVSAANVVEGPMQSPWLAAARREAIGLD
jgi:hypothetical protein